MIHSILSFSAEPASIIYIITGLFGAAFARRRSAKDASKKPSVYMSFCSRESRETMNSLDLT